MKYRTVLLSGVSLLAMTVNAHAFTAIGSAVISAFLAVGAGGLLPTAGAAAIGLGTLGALGAAAQLGLQLAFLGRRPSANPQAIKSTTTGTEGPGRYASGRVKLGAKIAFGNTAGYDIYRLGLQCFGPLDSIEEYNYDGRLVIVETDGNVSSPPFGFLGGSYLNIKSKAGDGTETAWGALITDFPTLWTADHRVRGIAQLLLKAINPGTGAAIFPRLYQGGVKEVEVVARVGKFFDPRDSSTAWSMNGVMQALHWYRLLPGITDSIIDLDGTEAALDEAETSVDTLTGTAPKCQLSGGWEGPLTYDIVGDMMESAGVEQRINANGEYRFAFLDDNPDAEITFLARHILSRDYQSGAEAARRPNVLRLSYFSPERGYEMAEIDLSGASWAKVQGEIDIYGEHEHRVELVFCPDASQAQRLGRRLFHMARADTGILRTTLAGKAAIGKKIIEFEVPDVGVDGASVMVKARKGSVRVNMREGYCEIPFQVIPDELKTAWDAATMEQPAPPVLEDFEFESELDTPAAPTEAAVVQYPGGGAHETRVKITTVAGGVTPEAIYRTYTAGNPDAWQSMTEYESTAGGTWYAWETDNTDGVEVDFKHRWFDGSGNSSYFSDVLNVNPLAIDNTATGAPTVTESGAGNSDPTLHITVPELRGVKVLVESNYEGGGWVTEETLTDIRPDIEREASLTAHASQPSETTLQWRVSSFTSNDTQGPYTTGAFIIPPTDP